MTWRFRTRIWRKNIDTVPRDYFILINNALMRCLHSGHHFRSFTNVLVGKTRGRGGVVYGNKKRTKKSKTSSKLISIIGCPELYLVIKSMQMLALPSHSTKAPSRYEQIVNFFVILNTENWSHGFPKESKVRMLWWIA